MSRRIAELNETHPLNVNAAECLAGYPWEPRQLDLDFGAAPAGGPLR